MSIVTLKISHTTSSMLKKYLLDSNKKYQRLSALLIVLIVAGVGTYLLVNSHAATPYASTTADKGILSNGAVSQPCSGASDGSCVVFKGTSGSGSGGTGGGTSSTRYVYCFGDPAWNYWQTVPDGTNQNGWWFDGTSNVWLRQYPKGYPQRVSFDDSVNVGSLIGCHALRSHLDPTDTDPNGAVGNIQRADIYLSDTSITNANKSPSIYKVNQPLLDDVRGDTTYYGYAFQTSSNFVVKPWPAWQTFQDWHASTIACASTCNISQQPIQIDVSTVGGKTNNCTGGQSAFSDGQPHLIVSLNGGNDDNANWTSPTSPDTTCLRYSGPDFIPGHTYRVIYKMTWGDHRTGAAQVWIDGVQYANVSGIDTMIYSAATGQQASVYMKFANYRHYDTSYPPQDIWFSGLVKGSSLSDVTIP
jgi:hypothetical protein